MLDDYRHESTFVSFISSWRLDYVEFYGHGVLRDEKEFNCKLYSALSVRASECTECEVCVERCPFEVDIIGKMRWAVEVFETT